MDIITAETATAVITIHICTVTTTHILSVTTIIAEVVKVVVLCVQIEMMFTAFLLVRRNKIKKRLVESTNLFLFHENDFFVIKIKLNLIEMSQKILSDKTVCIRLV